MKTDVADTFTASAEEWVCPCGRTNATGLSLCPRCGRVPPRGVATITIDSPFSDRPVQAPPRVRGVRLAVAVIVLNILTQGVTFAMVRAGRMESSRAIELATWIGLAFYCVVLAMILGPLLTLKPNWLRGDPKTARLLGAEVGFAAAFVLIAVSWAAAGHPVLDPGAQALVSEGSFARVVLALLVIAVVAPVVEELLFRGVVAESLRRHGPRVAIGVSSLLFAVAHLRSLEYYTFCGIVLGLLYWRRGLWASIAAHAAFNGSLVLLAVVVALGPSHLLASNGVSIKASSDWQLVDTSEGPADAALVVKGPSGANLVVQRHALPGARGVNLQRVAAILNNGQLPLPPDSTIDGIAQVIKYPAGEAVQVSVTEHGHKGVIVLLPRDTYLWEVDVATAGSDRAVREYPDLLQSLVLPASVGV